MTSLDLFRRAANGNAAAYQFLVDITDVAHFWDDLIDADVGPFTSSHTHKMMKAAVINLPRNSFYQAHFIPLTTLIQTAVQNWETANEFEAMTDPDGHTISFVLRSSYVDLVTYVARACGGDDLAHQISYDARKLVHSEGFKAYLNTLKGIG